MAAYGWLQQRVDPRKDPHVKTPNFTAEINMFTQNAFGFDR